MSDALAAALMMQSQQGQRADPYSRSRRMGELMMQQGMTPGPTRHPLEAASRALQQVVGGYITGKADEDQKTEQKGTLDKLARALGAPDAASRDAILREPGGDAGTLAPFYGQMLATKVADERKNGILGRRLDATGVPGAASGMGGGQPTPLNMSPQKGPADPAAFVNTMMPHALKVSQDTGLDPRLVLAQSALETGYGSAAPGNNYFGIKGPGQVLATQEAGPGGALVPQQASFRTYADPAQSASDYANLIKTNPIYAPVRQAQGLQAQIDAMGKSGYATDPNYTAKLRQIAQNLPPMLPDGTPITDGPQVAQGDALRADGSGNPIPPGPPQVAPAISTPNMPETSPAAQTLMQQAAKLRAGGDLEGALALAEKAQGVQATYAQERALKMDERGYNQAKTADERGFNQGKTAEQRAYDAAEHDRRYAQTEGDKPLTEYQGKSATYADRMVQNGAILERNQGQGTRMGARTLENLPFGVGNVAQDQDYRSFRTAKDNWIAANLRQESGAAIGAKEYADADMQYFPQPNDGPDVIAQKAALRKSATESMIRGAGAKYKPPESASAKAPDGAPVKLGTNGEGYDQIAPGAQYVAPDGSIRTKGGQ